MGGLGFTPARQGKGAAPSTGAVMGGHLCPTVFAACEMAKGTLAPKKLPRYHSGNGENSKGCGDVCRDSHGGCKRMGQDPPRCPTLAGCSQNEFLLLLPWSSFEDRFVTSGCRSPGTEGTGMSRQSRAAEAGAACPGCTPSSTLQQGSRIHLLLRP